MSENILVVKRRSKPRVNTQAISVGNNHHFAVIIHSDDSGNSYTSLNFIGDKPNLPIENSKPLIVFKNKNDQNTIKEILDTLNKFKTSMVSEQTDIFNKKDYSNITSRTIENFKSNYERGVKDKILIDQNESMSRTIIKKEYEKGGRNNFSLIFKTSNSIQPVFLLESLFQLGHLQKIAVEDNGSDEQIYEYASASTGQTYKTSVKSIDYLMTDDNINEPDSNVYKHFRPITNGGRSSFGLLRDLINDGLEIGINSGLDEKNYHAEIRKYIFDEISPLIDNEKLADIESDINFNSDGYQTQKVNNFSRLPRPIENHQEMNKFKRYFNNRGLSNQLLDKMIDKGVFYIGDFNKDNVKGEDSSKNIRDYSGQGYFRISDSLNRCTGGEKLSLYNDSSNGGYSNNRDPANMKIHKINTHIIQGNSFKFQASDSDVKGTIVGEAVIDALSTYEILKMAGQNPDQYNYSSIQGINNLSGFLEHNFGIKYKKDSKTKNYTYQHSEIIRDLLPISENDIDRVRKAFKSNMYYVNDVGNPDNELYIKKAKKFEEIYGIKVSVINVSDLNDKIFKPEEEAGSYTDRNSFDLLMNANGIHINRNVDAFTLKRKYVYNELTPENVEKCKDNIKKVFGSEKVIFVIDNDYAGQLDIQVIKDLKSKFGFDFIDMTPPKYGRNYKPDVNDILQEVINPKDTRADGSNELINKFLSPMGISVIEDRKINNNFKNKM